MYALAWINLHCSSDSRMKILFLLLTFCLIGCSSSGSKVKIAPSTPPSAVQIASGIPPSEMPCVIPKDAGKLEEMDIRKVILSQAATAFATDNFQELERQYTLYRDRTSITPGGLRKSKFFYEGIQDHRLFDLRNERDWSSIEAKLLEWSKAYPKSPAPYIAYSRALIDRAWQFRGGKSGDEVPPEAWTPFHENISLARSILEKNKETASVDPEWYFNMLWIAKAQGWNKSEVRTLLQEALSKEAYYDDIYHAAFSYLLPKWHGSAAEAEQFAQDAARITSKCKGKILYAEVYWGGFIANPEFSFEPSSDVPVNWEKMSAGFSDLVERYPVAWYVNSYAKFACLAKDKAKTRQLMKKIGNKPAVQAWEGVYPPAGFSACQKWASQT